VSLVFCSLCFLTVAVCTSFVYNIQVFISLSSARREHPTTSACVRGRGYHPGREAAPKSIFLKKRFSADEKIGTFWFFNEIN
jgi:hypothetical protein